MKRKPNTVGGGSQTNKNGLLFERTTDLVESFNNLKNYHVEIYPYKEKSRSGEVFKNRERIEDENLSLIHISEPTRRS